MDEAAVVSSKADPGEDALTWHHWRFQGNMPPQIKFMHPNANISTTHHEGPGNENATKGDCAWVASTDPIFGAVAEEWMKTLIEDVTAFSKVESHRGLQL